MVFFSVEAIETGEEELGQVGIQAKGMNDSTTELTLLDWLMQIVDCRLAPSSSAIGRLIV